MPYLPMPCVVKDQNQYKLETLEDRPTSFGRLKRISRPVRDVCSGFDLYMLSHGQDGLKQVSSDAVLNANYILASLKMIFTFRFLTGHVCTNVC